MSDAGSANRIHRYPGAEVTVLYEKKRCIHAAACVRGLPEVFNTRAVPWVQPDGAGREEVLAVIRRCPTGALKAQDLDGTSLEAPLEENVVTVQADGPLYVRGDVVLVNAAGETLLRDTRLALCRCGASQSKPLCDGSHVGHGFIDPGPAGELVLRNEPETIQGRELKITVRTNGSLLCEGKFRLLASDGARVAEGTKTSFCRCGHSANKPLCDGTHNKVGFVAE